MRFPPALFAFSCMFVAAIRAPAWNFAVWPGPDASQWAPALAVTNVVGIAAGNGRTLFIRRDGSIVWSSGSVWSGSTNALKVASSCHDLALLADSTVLEWGLEGCAGTAPYSTMPPGLTDVVAIAAGDRHSLVLKSDGTCVSWGWMTMGSGQAYVPDGLSNVVAIAAGFDISGALRSDGSVLAWGYPDYGGTAAPAGLSDGVAIAMGHHHGLVLRSNGTVLAWGTAPPPGLTNVMKIAAQQTWSLVYKTDGHLVAWNDGLGSQHKAPTQPLTNVLDISAGYYHGAVLVRDGPPQPLWHLSNQVALAGASVTFTGEALGTEPLSYQWLRDGSALEGAVTPTLTLTNVAPADGGTYAGVCSNAYGIVTNSGASLSVLPFLMTSEPTNASLYGGDTFLNSVTVEGQGLSYQWRHDGADLPGQTNAVLSIPTVTTNDAGDYSIIVTNAFGGAETSPVSLTVVPITIDSQPAGRSAYVGESTSFTVGASKNGPFSYQWRHNGANLEGQTNMVLPLTNLTLQQSGAYSVWVGNPYGSIESSNAILQVLDSAPILISQPRDVITWPGAAVTFQVGANGSKPLTYQWRLDGKDLPGATKSSLVIAGASTNDVGTYSATVTNALGGQVSSSAKLTLVPVVIWPDYALSVMPLTPALSNTVAVSAGNAFSLALRADGTVVTWGWQGAGELKPPALSNVTAVAAGDSHCLALRADGTVAAWGSNLYRQTNVPPTLRNVVAVATSDWYSLALRSDGTAVGWGYIDRVSNSNAVPGTDWNGVTAIAAGQLHRLGLRSDGTVVGWFDYSDYLLNRVPAGLSNVVAIAAAARHSLALKADGTVVAWGDKTGGLTNPPAGLSNVVAIACGSSYNLALKSDGSAVGWGANEMGATNIPTGLGSLAAIAASYHNVGLLAGSDPLIVRSPRSMIAMPLQPALLSVGAVSRRPLLYQWRFNGLEIPGATNAFYRIPSVTQAAEGDYQVTASNELGVATSAVARVEVAGVIAWGSNTSLQTNVPPGLEAIAVAGGYGHSLALRKDGRILAWGRGSTSVTNVPLAATNIVKIAAGSYHNVALKADGKVISWGEGLVTVPASLTNALGVAAGQGYSLALRGDATIAEWGVIAPLPLLLSNVVSVAAGSSFGLALRSDGSVISWGSALPEPEVTNVVAVAGGGNFAAALQADGKVVCWGADCPTAPPDLTNAVAIAAGGRHVLALRSDGTAVAWGGNDHGQATVPAGWTNIAAVGAGNSHSLMSVDRRDPLIVRQPASARAYSGNRIIFSVGARSALPLRFQWQHNGGDIPDATNNCLLLPAVQATDSGSYSVTVSNQFGSDTSPAALLTVADQAPFIRGQPTNLTVSGSAPVVFRVFAEGSEPKLFQWRRDGSPIQGATDASLLLPAPKRADEGPYSVVISNLFGSVTSWNATLRVMFPQRLHSPILGLDGSVSLSFGDSDGSPLSEGDMAHFVIDATTNLVYWEALTSNLSLTNGILWYSDQGGTNYLQRFYRVRELP